MKEEEGPKKKRRKNYELTTRLSDHQSVVVGEAWIDTPSHR